MKIAVIGTQCVGKSTYIKDFLTKWPMYETPQKSYRELLKEKNLAHSENSNEETQEFILNFLVDQASEYSKKDNVILDRSTLDCLTYTTWLHLKGLVSEEFLDKQRVIVRESLKLYDILFFLPLTKLSPVDIKDDGFRSINLEFREEIDNIFKVFEQCYHKGDGRLFPSGDSPAIIEIFGTPEERIKMTEFYITETGGCYGEEQSLITDIINDKF